MRILAVIVTFILIITSPKWTAGESCSEEGLRECDIKHQRYLHSVSESEIELGYDAFCEHLKNDSDCPMQLSEECKMKYPTTATQYTASVIEYGKWCNRSSSDRHVWFKIGFCISKHQKGFQKCFEYPPITARNESQQLDCEFHKFQVCVHGIILELCGEGREKLADYMKADFPPYEEYCSGCVGISYHWIIELLAFFLMLTILN